MTTSSHPTWVDVTIGALNGVLGDYLVERGNTLATPMVVVQGNEPVALAEEVFAHSVPKATPKVCVLVHGLCCTEAFWEFPTAPGTSYGTLLRDELGFTPVFLRYNTGLRISENGRALAGLLTRLMDVYPVRVEDLTLLGHSMGGLVIRSACLVAEQERMPWLDRLQRALYIGSPHLGAPLEKVGNVAAAVLGAVPDPFTRLARDLINRRSIGIKDLRHGHIKDEDWAGLDPDDVLTGCRTTVPLRKGIRHHIVAGTLTRNENHLMGKLFGDAMVPLRSATKPAEPTAEIEGFPPEHVRIYPGMHHMRLARDPQVYEQIRAWCQNGG